MDNPILASKNGVSLLCDGFYGLIYSKEGISIRFGVEHAAIGGRLSVFLSNAHTHDARSRSFYKHHINKIKENMFLLLTSKGYRVEFV